MIEQPVIKEDVSEPNQTSSKSLYDKTKDAVYQKRDYDYIMNVCGVKVRSTRTGSSVTYNLVPKSTPLTWQDKKIFSRTDLETEPDRVEFWVKYLSDREGMVNIRLFKEYFGEMKYQTEITTKIPGRGDAT